MLLSEIVWKSYVKYVVSFYVMWISTLLQSRQGKAGSALTLHHIK